MDLEKDGLPPYSEVPMKGQAFRRRMFMRRNKATKLIALVCLAFIAIAQWKQLKASNPQQTLSVERLQENLSTCAKLRHKPKDPVGLGREKNARYIDGHKPTLIQNATVWTGESSARKTDEYSWIKADVLIEYGLIKKVESDISLSSLPKDCQVYDAKGRQLTAGIIDMHSHAGVGSLPSLRGSEDTNELSDDITPYVRSIDGLNPLDHQIQVIKSGGVTTSLILPGSGNNMGGEAFIIKHAVGKHDGREEISAEDMLADPDRSWRYMKMACGENAKRVYGQTLGVGNSPFSRLGESWEFRHAFEQAASLVRDQDDWCNAANLVGVEKMPSYLPEDLKWESLGAVLRGQVHVNTHCYTIPDLEAFVDHTNEFKFPVRAFHHAHQTFLVPEILKRAYGDVPPASALFADNMYYKAEAYVASEFAGKILHQNGLVPIYVSDNPVLNAQHVVYEAAKAYRYGLPYHVAMASVTTAPAFYLGMSERLGKVKAGYDADIVVWDSDPLSLGAAPVQVWIDGTAQYKDPVELEKPISAPMVPDEKLGETPSEPIQLRDVIFTGISKVLYQDKDEMAAQDQTFTVVVSGGQITCIGTCNVELQLASKTGIELVHLENGHLTHSFTAFGSLLGLNEIQAESDTDNGPDHGFNTFSRGVDGLALDTKKLYVAHRYGVTRAITAPKFSSYGIGRLGTSVGFRTAAKTQLKEGAVWNEDVAVHYSLWVDAKSNPAMPSISAAVGAFRAALLAAVALNETIIDPLSEAAFMKKAVTGELPLVVTVTQADIIASVLRIKQVVEEASGIPLRLVIMGAAEAYILADELAAANVGVVLAPFLSYRVSWDERRALTGAPLTNGTAIDVLAAAGVRVAAGLEEDWRVRDLGLQAGIAYKNGGGKISEKEALGLVSGNLYKMLGLELSDDFLVFEGSPLEIDGRIRGVGSGGVVDVMV